MGWGLKAAEAVSSGDLVIEYIGIHIYICIYMYICVSVCTCMCTCKYINVCMCTQILKRPKQ
jgi:hypothetical protein